MIVRMRLCELPLFCCLLEFNGLTGSVQNSLKLHIYRSLGISATQDPNTGEFNRAVVRRAPSPEDSETKGDVHVINVDGKLSRGFYAGMFWDAL